MERNLEESNAGWVFGVRLRVSDYLKNDKCVWSGVTVGQSGGGKDQKG